MSASTSYISIGANRSSSCSATFEISSSTIFAYGAGKFLALWDIDSNQGVFKTLRGHPGQVTNVKSTSTGFLTGDSTGNVRKWAPKMDNISQWTSQWEKDIGSPVSALAVGEGDEVFVGGSDGKVRRFREGEELETLELRGKISLDMAVSRLPGSTDRKIQLWVLSSSTSQYRYIMSLEGHEDWVRCLSITSSGSDLLLASGSQDNYIRLWRISAPKSSSSSGVSITEKRGNGVGDVLDEFEKLASDDMDASGISSRVHVLNAGSEKFNITLDALLFGHESGVTNIHWSPPSPTSTISTRLLSTAADNSLVIWSPSPSSDPISPSSSGIWIPAYRFGTMGGRGLSFFGAVWAQGQKTVIATGWNGGVERWVDVGHGGEEVWVAARGLTGHLGEVQSVTWEPNGHYLLSTSSDQTSRIHARALNSWGEIARPQIHGYDMTDAGWISPLRFASCADEKVTRVFDATEGFAASLKSLKVVDKMGDTTKLPKGATVPPLGLSNRALGNFSTEPDIPKLHVSNEARDSISTTLSSLPTEEELSTSTLWPEIEKIYGHGYELVTLSISRHGDLIATACRASSAEHAAVRVVSSESWKTLGVLDGGHTLSVTRIAWSNDDQIILTVSRDRGWRTYRRVGEGDEVKIELVGKEEKAHTRMILDAAWASDLAESRYFLTAARDKSVKIWCMKEGRSNTPSSTTLIELVDTIKLNEAATAIDVYKSQVDGVDLVAVGTESGGIEVYTLKTGVTKSVFTLDQSITHVSAVNRLAWRPRSGGEDKEKTYQLASASEDQSVRVFQLEINIV